jgi:hypothetical protein
MFSIVWSFSNQGLVLWGMLSEGEIWSDIFKNLKIFKFKILFTISFI